MKTLCIGEALIDMICTNTGYSLAKGENFLKKPGGAPTNVAAALAALGGDVLLAAKVGDDPFGQHLVDVMNEFGVSTKWMYRDKEHFTTIAFVSLMEDGARDFVFNRGADGQLNMSEVDAINLDECSIVHFGSATAFLPGPLQQAYTGLLQKAANNKTFISFDPNYRQLLFANNVASFVHQSWRFIKQCHFFKVSDEEAMLLTGTSSATEAAKALAQGTTATFAITLGKEGTLFMRNGETVMVPSIPVKAIDSTGAGDAFVGAILFQLSTYPVDEIQQLTTDEWQRIIGNANKAGARTCEYMGAMEAFKHLSSGIFS